jgi:hypothetical protein
LTALGFQTKHGRMLALLALLLAVDAGTPPSETHSQVAKTPAVAQAPLRDAKTVLADYARAIGDEKLWKKHKSVRVKREVAVKSMQFVSHEETRIARGGKIFGESQMPGMGTFRRGCDGRVAWAEDPIGGLRALKGAEEEDLRIGSAWNSEWHLADTYRKVLSVLPPKAMPVGQDWECVELHKLKGQPTVLCFDRKTHLRVWEQGVQASQGGQVPYVTRFSDWRPVDGVLVWHHEVVTVGPVTMEGRIVEIVFDEPIPANLFALPRRK